MRILIDTLGDELISRTLVGIEGNLENIAAVEPDISAMLRRSIRSQFSTGGLAGSGGWAPLAPSTIERKRAAGLSLRILEATGDLRRSLTIDGARDSVSRVVGETFEFGTTVPYAKHHQHGTTRMPRRRPLQLSDGARRRAVKIIQDHVFST